MTPTIQDLVEQINRDGLSAVAARHQRSRTWLAASLRRAGYHNIADPAQRSCYARRHDENLQPPTTPARDTTWMLQAKCAARRDVWDREEWGTAVAICRTCPVQHQCLEDAMLTERGDQARWGVWGGLTAEQRHRLHKGAEWAGHATKHEMS